jgi:hypothetical protein
VIVERVLTARILDEVDGEPGALPLMPHVLLETSHRRTSRALTEAAYEAVGGIQGAIARTAEEIHAGFTSAQALLARRILLRLITPGEGAPGTRRPAQREEFDFGDPAATVTVLDRLARARLVTVDEDIVEVAHEALIAAWPRLRQWIKETRERRSTGAGRCARSAAGSRSVRTGPARRPGSRCASQETPACPVFGGPLRGHPPVRTDGIEGQPDLVREQPQRLLHTITTPRALACPATASLHLSHRITTDSRASAATSSGPEISMRSSSTRSS